MITAPYNFVPLNDKVFYPSWSDDVSHDIPFEDGESGEITIEIEAKSPIFIRNHYQEGDEYYEVDDKKTKEKIKISKEFCSFINKNIAREFYIPASSIKGMIRNTLEIMSFAKIPIDEEAHKKTLSVRDMTNKDLVATAQKCGFLVKTDKGYQINDCGKVLTISYHDIKNATNQWLKDIENVTDKYKKVKNVNISFKKSTKKMKVGNKFISKPIAVYSSTSQNIGQLVFTNKIDNKKNEFVFKENNTKYIEDTDFDSTIISNFKKVYFEDVNSELGQYWKGKNKIPIFYTTNQQGKITAIGLTQIFKLAYNKTILEASKQHIQHKSDFAECLFGYIDKQQKYKNEATKGRVYFSHLKSNIERYENINEKEEVLGSPNPTYYPNYIQQTNTNGDKVNKYITLMDKDAKISGWKQYLLQNTIQSNISNDNKNITTKFKPLDSGTKFKGKIKFHNLKKVEIGALLSALTFHNQEDTHFHNIGMAKPLGYGKIKITLSNFRNLKYKKEEYLKEFEKLMDSWNEKDYKKWKDSIQIKNLFAYHKEANARDKKYQQLSNSRNKNDFVEDKKRKEFLQPFVTNLINNNQNVKQKTKKVVTNTNNQQIQSAKTDIISKTKMRKSLKETWERVFKIFYHPNQIKEFINGEFKTTPKEQQQVYIKLKDNEKFKALIENIDLYNNDKLNEQEKIKLYNIIENLK